jgi:GNAT superfamily N-acetyltransferase
MGGSTLVTTRLARLADVSYVEWLRGKERDALGFMTVAAYEGVVTQQGLYRRPNARLWLAEVDGTAVGFLYATPGQAGGSLKIVQVALQRDARRQEYGTALVREAEAWAQRLQRPGVACRVRVDLEACAFWEALGYGLIGHERGGKMLNRRVNDALLERRYRPLPCGLLLALEGAQPGHEPVTPDEARAALEGGEE